MSTAYWEMVDREAQWMEQYGLRKSKARECLRWVAGARCIAYRMARWWDNKPCDGHLPWFDHTYVYIGANGLRILVTQPYWLEPDRVQEAHKAAQRHGIHVAPHADRRTSWWFRDTRMVVFSNKPIPAHGYRFDYDAWEARHAR